MRNAKHLATAQRLKNGNKDTWTDDDIFFTQEDLYIKYPVI